MTPPGVSLQGGPGRRLFCAGLLLSLLVFFEGCRRGAASSGEPLRIAVASNFAPVLEKIADGFERQTGAAVVLSGGSSGKLFAQADNGAPFDVFLSADSRRARELESRGLSVPGSRFQYALGRLVVCGRALQHPEDGIVDLKAKKYDKIAIANPDTAPYGVAARTVLRRIGVWDELSGRVVQGENIAQGYQFVESGAADIGLVARSLTVGKPGKCFLVPQEMHDPIVQEGVVMRRAASDDRARAFVVYLQSEPVRQLLVDAGYDAPAKVK